MINFLNKLFLLLALLNITNFAYALSDYEIKNICKDKKNKSNCQKYMRNKRYNLFKGNMIEIPVIPYKK